MICYRPLISHVLSLLALILTLFCLFAGSNRQFLPNASIFKVNTSAISIPNAPDFFNVYLMNYCYGFEKECIVDDDSNTTTIQRIITSCSDLSPLSHLDPGQALTEILGTSIPEMGWPSYLSDDFNAIAPTSQSMAILFIIGTCSMGLSILLRIGTVRYIWQPSGPSGSIDGTQPPPSYPGSPKSLEVRPLRDIPPSKFQLLIAIFSAFILLIATIIATLISTQFVSLISQSGDNFISVSSSSNFLGMAWTSVIVLIFLAGDALLAFLRYRARHCHCDWDETPAISHAEGKRLFSGYD